MKRRLSSLLPRLIERIFDPTPTPCLDCRQAGFGRPALHCTACVCCSPYLVPRREW